MKKLYYIIFVMFISGLLASCTDDFDEINENPDAITEDKVDVSFMLTSSMTGSQMNPHIAERIWVLQWADAARYYNVGALSSGWTSDGWGNDYMSQGYFWSWINSVDILIDIVNKREEKGTATPKDINVKNMARIWRVYLYSRTVDSYGAIPYFEVGKTVGGASPMINSVEEIYKDFFKEIKEAVDGIKVTVDKAKIGDNDIMYQGDPVKWRKLGNTLRLRLALRVSKVDATLGKTNAEAAVAHEAGVITSNGDNGAIDGKGGWNDLCGVYSRPWNHISLSPTMRNLMSGLGGIDADTDAPKRAVNHMGIYAPYALAQTNDPMGQYLTEGVPAKLDPRAFKYYALPGDTEHTRNLDFGDTIKVNEAKKWDAPVFEINGTDTIRGEYIAKNSWFAINWSGEWDKVGSLNTKLLTSRHQPVMRKTGKYKPAESKHVHFSAAETNFLLAEAAHYGWNVGGTAKDFYEKGIEESFAYNDVSSSYSAYIASEDFNRNGTSVKFDHNSEAAALAVTYYQYKKDGSKELKNGTYNYPVNTAYGNTNNDVLTKIITQKYIAGWPWNVLEAWSDHRRLNLPFFPNPVKEIELTDLDVNPAGSYKQNFPRRMKYPSKFKEKNSHYESWKSTNNFTDDAKTDLWWAK